MHLSFFSVLGFLAKMNDNYNSRVKCALNKTGRKITDTFQLSSQLAPSLTQQIETCYNKISNETLYRALFPGWFHGKCLDAKGNEPKGCPNYDCSIRCGTPGSMIHFYYDFYRISFATTNTTSPGPWGTYWPRFPRTSRIAAGDRDCRSANGETEMKDYIRTFP
ncbi:hypothetical protein B0H14DRAFT_2727897 [Mycena olivaceomarginata]|nr:hypothetical protein B0H14DRAFT_2727897 [Mycena olivaceomarginata]